MRVTDVAGNEATTRATMVTTWSGGSADSAWTTGGSASFGGYALPLLVEAGDELSEISGIFGLSVAVAQALAPKDRKAALIAAFEATMKDPEFLSEAQKLSIDVAPVTAAHLNSLLADLYATPKAVLQKAAVAVAK